MKNGRLALVVPALLLNSACAVGVPHMGDIGVSQGQRIINEGHLVAHIQCELHLAFQRVRDENAYAAEVAGKAKSVPPNPIAWLDGWGAKVSLDVQVEAKSTLSPGLTLTDTLQNALKVFGQNGNVTLPRKSSQKFGASITSDVTRQESIAYTYALSKFLPPPGDPNPAAYRLSPPPAAGEPPKPVKPDDVCARSNVAMDDDLQIYDFLKSKIALAERSDVLGQKPGDPPFSALSFDVHFIVTKSASFTPIWQLAQVSADADGALLNGTRVKTDHLLITFGKLDANGKAEQELQEVHQAKLIGQAVFDAFNGRNLP